MEVHVDLTTLMSKLAEKYEQTMTEIKNSPKDLVELERKCKISFIEISLESIDKETRWNLMRLPKSTEWVE